MLVELRRIVKGAIVLAVFLLFLWFLSQLAIGFTEWLKEVNNQRIILIFIVSAVILAFSWGIGTIVEEGWELKEDGNDPLVYPDEK